MRIDNCNDVKLEALELTELFVVFPILKYDYTRTSIIKFNKNMKKTFLEYYKMVLCKVSFDLQLFKKEYQKAKESLNSSELLDLNSWLENKGLSPSLLLIEV